MKTTFNCIVASGAYDPGAVSTVIIFIPVFVVNRVVVVEEIPSINVVDESVAVIVNTRFAVQLSLVHPHVRCQIGMVILYALVNDAYDYISRMGAKIPRLRRVNVSICRRNMEPSLCGCLETNIVHIVHVA